MEDAAHILARHIKWPMCDVRDLIDDLEAVGVFVNYAPTTGELCPNCAEHYATESGFCVRCEAEAEAEQAEERMEAERAELAHNRRKLENVIKTQRKRMRARFLANPRDRENRMRWKVAQELLEAIEQAQGEEEGDTED